MLSLRNNSIGAEGATQIAQVLLIMCGVYQHSSSGYVSMHLPRGKTMYVHLLVYCIFSLFDQQIELEKTVPLQVLTCNKTIKKIDLYWNNIGNKGLEAICGSLRPDFPKDFVLVSMHFLYFLSRHRICSIFVPALASFDIVRYHQVLGLIQWRRLLHISSCAAGRVC
jgi:hypothetical protein